MAGLNIFLFWAFLLNHMFLFSFQVYTPKSLVAYAVKEVAKVYRFYDQDAFSFVRNIDYHPLTITDSVPLEISIKDLHICFCCINRQEQKRILESARHSLVKRRQAIDEIFDSIAKMVVNFGNKNEVDELDLKKLRVKTSNYHEIMDFLESVGVEVKLENILEKMLGHIQKFRFRAKLLNLAVNQSYLGCGEKVEDVESAGINQGKGVISADMLHEYSKDGGMKRAGEGFTADTADHKEEVNAAKIEEAMEDVNLEVQVDAESTGDGLKKVGADTDGQQEVYNKENIGNFIEVTNLADGCFVKFAEYCPGDRLKIEEEYYKHSRNNGIERTGGGEIDDHQGKVHKERIEEKIEKVTLAVGDDKESVSDIIRVVGGSIEESKEMEISEAGHGLGDDIESADAARLGGENIADYQIEVNEERIEKEIEDADLAVGHDMESAGDYVGDRVKLEVIESDDVRERDLREIKITIEEEADFAVGNQGLSSGDELKIDDMIGDCDRVGKEQLLLGSTTDKEGELSKERKSVGKKETDSTIGDDMFGIEDEEEDHFVLYGMIRCS